MSAMLAHMEGLLEAAEASKSALSFAVFIPHWPKTWAWQVPHRRFRPV